MENQNLKRYYTTIDCSKPFKDIYINDKGTLIFEDKKFNLYRIIDGIHVDYANKNDYVLNWRLLNINEL